MTYIEELREININKYWINNIWIKKYWNKLNDINNM